MPTWRDLGFKEYREYLASSWFRSLTKQLITQNRKARCWICGKKNTLLLHHVKYDNLGNEKLGRDVYILCFTCHTRTHFTTWGYRVPLEKSKLLARMKFLKVTYPVRNFRIGSLIQSFWTHMS